MSGDYLERYSLERARVEFHQAGRQIDAAAEVPGRGWVILWHDDGGYTVSYTQAGGAWTSGALFLADALSDFRRALDRCLQGLAELGE